MGMERGVVKEGVRGSAVSTREHVRRDWCVCGSHGDHRGRCRRTPQDARCTGRGSRGQLLDRFDPVVEVPPVDRADLINRLRHIGGRCRTWKEAKRGG